MPMLVHCVATAVNSGADFSLTGCQNLRLREDEALQSKRRFCSAERGHHRIDNTCGDESDVFVGHHRVGSGRNLGPFRSLLIATEPSMPCVDVVISTQRFVQSLAHDVDDLFVNPEAPFMSFRKTLVAWNQSRTAARKRCLLPTAVHGKRPSCCASSFEFGLVAAPTLSLATPPAT